MGDWTSVLKGDPTQWLLEEDNPSVRYFTLRDILEKPREDNDVQAAKEQIMKSGIVPRMLEAQQNPDYLKAYPRFYTYKYKGLVWSLIAYAELGAQMTPQIREQCEYILQNCQEPTQGGFSQSIAVKAGGGRITEVIPCLSGNMVYSLITLGYLDDPRVQKGIDWLVNFMKYNDGAESDPQQPPYSHYETCWGRHTCHMGAVKALKAFDAIPKERRTPEITAAADRAAEFMLIHHIHRRSHDFSKTSKPGWLRFGFPLMYQTDVLEILDLITSLGYHDPRMEEAVEAVIAKQTDGGRWRAENSYGDRMLVPFDTLGQESKWVTLRALRVLKRWGNTSD